MPLVAEMKMQNAMAQIPEVTTTEGHILENFMDKAVNEPVTSYAATKSSVKKSFLEGIVGPADEDKKVKSMA